VTVSSTPSVATVSVTSSSNESSGLSTTLIIIIAACGGGALLVVVGVVGFVLMKGKGKGGKVAPGEQGTSTTA
jgi:hypothetical protein